MVPILKIKTPNVDEASFGGRIGEAVELFVRMMH